MQIVMYYKLNKQLCSFEVFHDTLSISGGDSQNITQFCTLTHTHTTPTHPSCPHTPSQFRMCLLLQSQLAHHVVRSCSDCTRGGIQTSRHVPRLAPSHAGLPGSSCECNPYTSHNPHTSQHPYTSQPTHITTHTLYCKTAYEVVKTHTMSKWLAWWKGLYYTLVN